MEAREFAEHLKEAVQEESAIGDACQPTEWGYGDADFFVDVEDEGRFLVSVVKVSE